jgi:Phosphofructokinase
MPAKRSDEDCLGSCPGADLPWGFPSGVADEHTRATPAIAPTTSGTASPRSVARGAWASQGSIPASGFEPQGLLPADVMHMHRQGGSVVGLSRGADDVTVMVDTFVRRGIDVLFTIGGDGTLKGPHRIAVEIAQRGLPIAVVGVPKTIDNDRRVRRQDIRLRHGRRARSPRRRRSAHRGAQRIQRHRHREAHGPRRGFIAASATVASQTDQTPFRRAASISTTS